MRRNVRYKLRRNYSDLDILAWPTPGASPEWAIWSRPGQGLVPTAIQVKWRKTFPYPLSGAKNDGFAWWIIGNDKMLGEAGRLLGSDKPWDLMLVAPRTTLDLPEDALQARARGLCEQLKNWYRDETRCLRDLHLVPTEDLAVAWMRVVQANPSGWDETEFSFAARLLTGAGVVSTAMSASAAEEYLSHVRCGKVLSTEQLSELSSGEWARIESVASKYLKALSSYWEMPQTTTGWSGTWPDSGNGKGWWIGRTSRPWWLGIVLTEGCIRFVYIENGKRIRETSASLKAEAIQDAEKNWLTRCFDMEGDDSTDFVTERSG